MKTLNQSHCIPCQVGAPTLTPQEIEKLRPQIDPEWEIIDHKKLLRNFKFPNFKAAIKFINQVADLAESEGHHPNIHLTNWNRVALELYTHKISGLHRNDFILASKIDALMAKFDPYGMFKDTANKFDNIDQDIKDMWDESLKKVDKQIAGKFD